MRYVIVVIAVLFACGSAWGIGEQQGGAGKEGEQAGPGREGEQVGSGRAVKFEGQGSAQVGETVGIGHEGGDRKEKVLSVNEGPGGEQTIKTYDPQSGKYWLYRTEGEGASEGSDEGASEGFGAGGGEGFGEGASSGGNEW